nr:hypothetical protein [Amycolatopsis pithecellobii]
METLPLPPEPAPQPPAPVSAHRQVLAAYDRIAEAGRPELWTTLRPAEDVLVEAKAIDVRVRAGESPPLAGVVTAVEGTVDAATAARLLTDAGAVVLGETGQAAVAVVLGLVDIAIGTTADPAGCVALSPTPGLVPVAQPAERVTVFARTVGEGQQALTACDPGSCGWPSSVRLSAGERPRLAISAGTDPVLRKAAGDLLAAGACVETAGTLTGYDALLLPATGDLTELPGLPVATVAGISVVAKAFEDQVALDIAAFLNGEQLRNPYPAPHRVRCAPARPAAQLAARAARRAVSRPGPDGRAIPDGRVAGEPAGTRHHPGRGRSRAHR